MSRLRVGRILKFDVFELLRYSYGTRRLQIKSGGEWFGPSKKGAEMRLAVFLQSSKVQHPSTMVT